jgi:circadian clock protein KaiB
MLRTRRESEVAMAPDTIHKFRLYVAGNAPNSVEALNNLHRICDQHLRGRHEIEVVDVFRVPKRALVDGIFMTPSLLRLSPGPSRRIIGTLRETETVLHALGLAAHE